MRRDVSAAAGGLETGRGGRDGGYKGEREREGATRVTTASAGAEAAAADVRMLSPARPPARRPPTRGRASALTLREEGDLPRSGEGGRLGR